MTPARAHHVYRRLRAWLGRPRLQVQRSVVLESDIAPCPNPIFVMGCHRSGTTLLRRILNAHPNIACPPESFFLRHFFEMATDEESRAGLAAFTDAGDIDRTIGATAFRLHEAFRLSAGKGRWADKTPGYVRYFQQIRRIAPPGTQFIVILRDPFDVAFSIYDRGWVLERLEEGLFANTLAYVARTFDRLERIVAEAEPLVIRYEALATDPEPVTREICRYLGEPWDAAMLRPWEAQQNFGVEDPLARSQRRFEISRGNWQALSAAEKALLEDRLGVLRARLGYAEETA